MVLGPPRSGKTSSGRDPRDAGRARRRDLRPRPSPTCSRHLARARADRPGVAVRPDRRAEPSCHGDAAAVLVAGRRRANAGTGRLLMARAMAAMHAPRRRGTTNEQHWRERSAALLAPLLLRRQPQPNSRSPSVLRWVLRQDLEPARADPRGPRRRRSPTTCSSGSRRPTSASAPRSSPPPPASSPPTTPTPTRHSRRQPQLRPRPLRRLDRHDLHHRPRPQAGALRAARRRPARADPPRHLRPRPRRDDAGPPMFCASTRSPTSPRSTTSPPSSRGRRPGTPRHGLPAGPLPGPRPLGRGRSRRVPLACSRPS